MQIEIYAPLKEVDYSDEWENAKWQCTTAIKPPNWHSYAKIINLIISFLHLCQIFQACSRPLPCLFQSMSSDPLSNLPPAFLFCVFPQQPLICIIYWYNSFLCIEKKSVSTCLLFIFMLFAGVLLSDLRVPLCRSHVLREQDPLNSPDHSKRDVQRPSCVVLCLCTA